MASASSLCSSWGWTTTLFGQTALPLRLTLSVFLLGTLDTLFTLALLPLLSLRQGLSSIIGLHASSSHTLSNALLSALSSSCHTVFVRVSWV